MKAITEQTKISISLMIMVIGSIVWLTKLYVITESTAKAVEVVQVKQEKYSEDISQIKSDIAVIKRVLEGK
jgi:hypothetical protein